MSLLANQTAVNSGSSFFSGETSFVSQGATTSPYVQVSNIVLSNSANTTPVLTIANSLYPDVGKTYLATANGYFDPAWASGPSGGAVQVNLYYQVGSNVLYTARQANIYDSNSAVRGVNRFALPLVFQHSDPTGVILIGVVNGSGTTTTASILQLDSCSITEMSSSSAYIGSNAVSDVYTP
jgi:hypothetical protein